MLSAPPASQLFLGRFSTRIRCAATLWALACQAASWRAKALVAAALATFSGALKASLSARAAVFLASTRSCAAARREAAAANVADSCLSFASVHILACRSSTGGTLAPEA